MVRICYRFIVLYLAVLVFFVTSLYVYTFYGDHTRHNRCANGNNIELCLYEENQRSVQQLIMDKQSLTEDSRSLNSQTINADDKLSYNARQKKVPADFIHDLQASSTSWRKNPSLERVFMSRKKDGEEEKDSQHNRGKVPPELNKLSAGLTPFSWAVRPFPKLYKPVLDNGLDCSKVWQGDRRESQRAVLALNDTLPALRPPGFYEGITKDCPLYRRTAGFIETSSKEERDFPLAFSIMVYKEPEQLERLLRAVYRPQNVYCIHMDMKTEPKVLLAMRAIIDCLPNVVEAPRQVNVVWGKFSVLEIELLCMETLWKMKTRWKYLINLTGQEFPLKTNKELVRILTAYRGANDILGETPRERNRWRWDKAGVPAPHNITVAKGPVHVAASRGFINFLLHSKHAQDLLTWTKKTGIPDETFFATVNNMHQFRVPGSYTGSLTAKHRIMLNRFKIWDITNRTCSGQFIRHICHFGPSEVTILAHSRHLIGNKFTYNLYPLAYDCTEQWYFDRVRREEKTGVVDINTKIYSTLYIVKHAYREEKNPWG